MDGNVIESSNLIDLGAVSPDVAVGQLGAGGQRDASHPDMSGV